MAYFDFGRPAGLFRNRKRTFSELEKELLIASAKKREFCILSVDEIPNWIRIEGKISVTFMIPLFLQST
jgi:hypothetical protein